MTVPELARSPGEPIQRPSPAHTKQLETPANPQKRLTDESRPALLLDFWRLRGRWLREFCRLDCGVELDSVQINRGLVVGPSGHAVKRHLYLTGIFCASESERKSTLKERWYAYETVKSRSRS